MSYHKLLLATGVLLLGYRGLHAQNLETLERSRVKLPNGWSLTPVGKSLPLGDLPLNIAISKSHRFAAVTNDGESTQTIQLLDAVADSELDKVEISRAWGGIVFSADERSLYVSGGDNNWIVRYDISNKKLNAQDTIKLGAAWGAGANATMISPTGLALDDRKGVLYVVTKQDNSLYLIDIKTKAVTQKIKLAAEAYTCLLSPDNSKLYISIWGGDKVAVFDTKLNQVTNTIAVGDNPNDLCLSHNNKYLYVANANDNTVSVISLQQNKVLETLNTAVYPTPLSGTTSNSVALSKDDKTLYIANADNNCLAVFDVSQPGKSKSQGFIPTGWYPSVVRVIDNKLYVANGKGFSSLPNPHGPNPISKKQTVLLHGGDPNKDQPVQYIGGGLLMGTLSIIDIPKEQQLSVYSQAVYHNTPYSRQQEHSALGEPGNPVPVKVGDKSPIKHVFYIIQENRTYDQVLSDMPKGNGDTSLLLFGRRITPNHHALAENFVLLDNFYVDGEVSADGHNWSLGAYATDYMEKNWPTSYGHHGKGATGNTGKNKLYIWDAASRANISYRTYGEFINADNTPQIAVLKDHFAKSYPTRDLLDPDTLRYEKWEKDFDSLMRINAVPQLSTLRMLSDHTEGTKPGRPTPFAHVADNDLAVGRLVEHISKSPIWENSVIFILEDDAQNGPDHVDAHRSPAYIAGGFVKRGFVDHTMYSTSSMLRTMELILGLAPMTQYDASATPMWRCFTSQVNKTPFNSLPSNINLNELNPRDNKLGALSKGLDFSGVDKVPDAIMNNMLWKAIKGINATAPSPVRAAFVKATASADGDDD
ncbi:bifunctional YncE family protein/alkaline phosphatase family protein [Mucilaginibacter mali]|uniref:Bifunctional YncE family protein/alkaline phosphatase family protein n=1 Tax=Mucilaginibacter mali TaxID=2740462 RepID=A0A7D4QSH8_9SPHI|nr:beta-propeller fold lactonase family protein [Mucilaginibacter mali]QKJ30029.1 bifunctional YncE family protein/alkaline phosphatase family protein [Mucilaginibacter mali]